MAESGSQRCLLSVIRSCAGPKICRAGLAVWRRFRGEQMSCPVREKHAGFRHDGSASGLTLPISGPRKRTALRKLSGQSGASPHQVRRCPNLRLAIGYSLRRNT